MKALKFLAIFCLPVLAFVGCATSDGDDNNGSNDSGKQLLLVADKNTIYDNGEDTVTFSLYYDGMTLTEGYEIYAGETLLAGNTFASTVQGTHTIWASYGALISNDVSVNVVATPPAAPAAPEDTNPEKTNFVRRVLLTQFTGTNCGWCPYMINALHEATTKEHSNKIVIAAAHLFNNNGYGDPAHLFESQTLDNAMGVSSYPNLVTDLDKSSKNIDYFYANVAAAIDKAYNRVAVKGGIAVNSEYHAEENYIVINATVKAKTTGEFRIGAWLLEDDIYGKQANGGLEPIAGVDFNNHENCIRIANSKKTNTDFSGFDLGTIEAGKTASREFAFPLKPNGTGSQTKWNHDNLRVIVFISTKEGNTWLVNNVVKCPKEGSVDFEYMD